RARRFQRLPGFHFQIGGVESRNSAIDSLLRLLGEDDKDDVRFEGGKDMDSGGEGLWRWENRVPGNREGESITSSAFDAAMRVDGSGFSGGCGRRGCRCV
ncbi:unnamed protein product, partial [Linum tenue]